MKRLAAAFASLFLIFAAPVSAATWTAPAPIAPEADGYGTTSAAFTPRGVLQVAWTSYYRPPGCEYHCNPPNHAFAAALQPAGAWSPPAPIGDSFTLAAAGTTAAGRGLAIGSIDEFEFDSDEPHAVAEVEPGQPPREVWRAPGEEVDIWGLTASIGARGDAVAAWSIYDYDSERTPLYAALRSDPGHFGKAKTLAPDARVWETAASPRGHAAVVWIFKKRVYARVAKPGKGFGPQTTVARPRSSVGEVTYARPVVDDRGRLTVVETVKKGGNFALWVARSDGKVERLASPSQDVLTAAGGDALVAWQKSDGVHMARFAGGRGVRSTVPGTAGAVPFALRSLPNGRAALGVNSAGGIGVSLRAPGGGFAAPELAVPADVAGSAPALALDPTTGEPAISFSRSATGERFEVLAAQRVP